MKRLLKTLLELILPEYLIIIIFNVIISCLLLDANIIHVQAIILIILVFALSSFALNTTNNICDIEIDGINKPERPLPKKRISLMGVKLFSIILAISSITLSIIINHVIFILVFIFNVLSILYSVPPIRIKRLIFSDGFIGGLVYGTFPIIAIWSIVGGTFPTHFAILLFLLIFSLTPIKNIEDIEGEKKHGIKSVPALIGIKNTIKLSISIETIAIIYIIIISLIGIINYKFIYPSFVSLVCLPAFYAYLNLSAKENKKVKTQSNYMTISMIVITMIGILYGITAALV